MSRPVFVHCLNSIPNHPSKGSQSGFCPLMKSLSDALNKFDLELIDSDEAFFRLQQGTCIPSQLMLLADETSFNKSAAFLLRKGAFAFFVFSGESPFIARDFYNRLGSITRKYKYKMLFSAFSDKHGCFIFPAYSIASPAKFVSMTERRFSVIVSANKFYRPVSGLNLWKPRRLFSYVKQKFNLYVSPFVRSLRNGLLYENRLEILAEFKSGEELDLFGSGWDSLANLPSRWRTRLGSTLRPMGKCEDKISTISNYRFCFAIENHSYPSYFTEKLIEAIHAGCVPVYLGAPDVCSIVPKECFLDIRNYSSIETLKKTMLGMSLSECEDMVIRGQNWLTRTTAGLSFSREAFADRFISNCVRTSGFLTNQQ